MEQPLIDIDYEPVFSDEPAAPVAPVAPPAPTEDRATREKPEPPAQTPETGYTLPKVTEADLPKVSLPDVGGKQAEVKAQDIDYEPVFEDTKPAEEKHGFVSNIVRGVGERSVQLIGGTAGTIGDIVEGAGDWLDQKLGKPMWDADGNLSWRRPTAEETKGNQIWLTQKLQEVQKGMTDPDFGYNPGTTWQDVKNAPFTNVIPFAVEQGLVSLPDMVAAVKNAPLYIIEQAGEIGGGRAQAEGRTEPTFGDIMKAMPAAVISQLMEKIGTEKLFGVGEAALTELKQLPAELLKTLATEGATEAAQQAAQYSGEHAFTQKGMDWWELAEQSLQAGLVGAIFGPAVRSATGGAEIATAPKTAETGPKKDDQPGVAAETLPEGTPAAKVPDTPVGGLAAGTAPQPAGTEKQPEDPTTPTEVKTPPTPAGGVHVVTPNAPDPDLAAAAAGTPVERPAAAPVEAAPAEEAPPEFNIRETFPEEATPEHIAAETSAHEARIAGMFHDELEAQKVQAAQAGQTKVATAGDAEAAAIAAQAPKPMKETLGTDQILNPPGQPAAPGPAKIATPQVAAAPSPIIPAAPATVAETPVSGPNAPTAEVSGEPAPVPGPAASPAADVSLRRARAAQGVNRALATNDPAQIAAAKSEFLDAMQELQRVDPEQFSHFANTPGNKQLFPELAAFTAEPAAAPAAQLPAAPVTVGEPKAVEPPLPGAKGEALKRRKVEIPSRAQTPLRAAPAPEAVAVQPEAKRVPEKAAAAKAVSKSKEQLDKQLAQERAAAHEKAQAAEVEARKAKEAARPRLAKDIHRDAKDELRRTLHELGDIGNIGEGKLEQMVGEEADVAAKETQGQTPAEKIREGVKRVVERVKQRLEDEETAALEAHVSDEERQAQEVKLKAEAKQRQQAAAPTGQKKERAGAEKGKSGTGIRVESEKATLAAIAREMKKPEAERDPLLMAWQAVHAKQKVLPKNPKPENKADVEAKRTLYKEQKQQVQELRAQKVEAAAAVPAGPKPLDERATKVRDQVKEVLAKHPLPFTRGEASEKALLAHFTAFRDSLRAAGRAGLKLADHISRHQSMEENLAIFASKVRAKRPALTDPQGTMYPHDFATAQLYQENGADRDFYGLTTNETLSGTGYNEAVGEDTEVSAADQEHEAEDTSHVAGTHRQYEATPSPDEEQMLVRSGRAETRERAASRIARDEAAYKEQRPLEVTRPETGKKVTVRAETRKASDVLREIHRLLQRSEPRGFVSILQNAMIRHLSQMVGNVDVHFVSAADMMQLHDQRGVNPAGLYYNYSAEERAAGARPQVFINEEIAFHGDEYTHAVIHELTHAATSLALRENIRGTADIVKNLMGALNRQMSPEQLKQFGYAFKNPAEFIAEAFSNANFQEALAQIRMPDHLARQISGVSANRKPSLWDGVVAMVSNAVGMLFGQRGQSYMEQVAKLFPEISHSEQGQRVLAREQAAKGPARFQRAVPTHPVADIQALNLNFDELVGAAKSRLANLATPKGRMLNDILSTSGQMIRSSEALFGGENNAEERKIKAMLKREGLAQELRSEPVRGANSEDLELAVLNLRDTDKAEYRELSDVLRESRRYKVDPTVGLNHPSNGHVNKTGPRHQQQRSMHAALEQRWNAMSTKAQDVGRQTIDHFRTIGEYETDLHIKHALENAALNYGAKPYPAGKTIDDAVAWVKSGDAARDFANQTQADKDWHAALGKTAETLAKVPMLRKIKGIYVPFMRRGKYFISATERPFGTMANPTNLPAGARMDAENRLMFLNRADVDAFSDTHPGQVTVAVRYVDPQNTSKVVGKAPYVDPATNQLVIPRAVWFATVQTKRVEMSDNSSQLKARAKALRDAGHHASAVGLSKQGLEKAIHDISPREIQSLINNLAQTTIGQTTVGQEAVANAVRDAYIRRQTSASHVQRSLKSRNVLGEDEDLLLAVRDYNRQFAHHVSNMIMAPELARTSKEVDDYIKAQQHIEPTDSNLTSRRQAMNAEVDNRIKGHPGDSSRSTAIRTLQAVKQIVYMAHLASPHFSIMNAMQPTMTTLPVLSAKYGPGAAARQLGLAYGIAGVKAVTSGTVETGRALKNLAGRARKAVDNDQFWHDEVAGQADATQLRQLFEMIRHLGWGSASGLEAGGVGELDMNWVEKRINRMVNVAKALPEAIEGVNRYTTAIAAYRCAVLSGMSHESAMREAALTVEQTQGGYGAANNPTFFRNPLLQPALQFKKYALNYGNLYWRNVAAIFSSDPVARKQAAKTVAGLSLATVAMAGAYGLPLVEPLRWLVFAAQAAGLSDDDWDTKEVAMQKFLAEMIAWATGSKSLGDALAEANMRGYTRLASVDTSNSFGNDSLFLFGQPKSSDASDIEAWLWKAASGAPGGMLEKSYKALQKGDPIGAIPWPKIMASAFEAYKLKTEGTVSPKTGEKYGEPVGYGEAAAAALGFKPASTARQWEGGSGSQSKAMKQTHGARADLMAQWRNASGADRAQIWREDVRDWNASHRNPDDKIQMQDLMSSVRSKRASNKRQARAALYAD